MAENDTVNLAILGIAQAEPRMPDWSEHRSIEADFSELELALRERPWTAHGSPRRADDELQSRSDLEESVYCRATAVTSRGNLCKVAGRRLL
jgi:hypothetical protein